ncbi:hypothetical protein DH2020_024427 [Rehmannia glutinosa]|uniref:K Homology domain-containing protein n=1 Tax=Rehmannia glutinosa TaxID=99300 RepID=A0ABR0W2F1_REHGL
MGTEVEHASCDIQTTVTTPSSTASTSGPKMSMFGKKVGFVIPKNKLSGSLVPIYRGTKKGDADLVNEDATNQVLRKTKWGPDLTLDTTVRKGRALAYQTRINQISQQLTLGTLEVEDNEDVISPSEFQYGRTSDHQLNKEETELLELEKREIIGEVLKLNPTYKAPTDYKPLLKEAKVPIPIKEYPGYNFIGLVFGPASDTQKRLEKETGAKIHVYGTKSDTGGKVEVTPAGKEIDNTYEDLYVQVSADTFEKIDAAVALIELLLTRVSVNPVSSSTTSTSVSDNNAIGQPSQSTTNSTIAPSLINQGSTQPYSQSGLVSVPPPQSQFPQYPRAWFPAGPTHTPTYSQSGLVNPTNISAPFLSNTVQVSSSFGPRPVVPANFSPGLQNPPVFPSRPQPAYMQQAPPVGQTGGPRNTPLPYNIRPVTSTLPQSAPLPAFPNNMISPQFGSSQSAGPVAGQQSRGVFPPSESGPSTIQPSSIGPAQPAMAQLGMRAPSPNAIPGARPMPFMVQSFPQPGIRNSFSGNAQNFDSSKPTIPRPQQPSSVDFTFQPHHPPNAASQIWRSNQPAAHNVIRPSLQSGPASLAPQSPMLRPVTAVQGFPRLDQPRAQIPTNFAGSPTGPFPPRHPNMPGHHGVAAITGPHMQPRNFIPPHPINNCPGPFPPRPGNQMHVPENHLRGPQRFPTPHQHFGNHPGRPFPGSSGAVQTYDPFSPTSVRFNPQMGGNGKRVHSESDPEYDDLMASVGVQ